MRARTEIANTSHGQTSHPQHYEILLSIPINPTQVLFKKYYLGVNRHATELVRVEKPI